MAPKNKNFKVDGEDTKRVNFHEPRSKSIGSPNDNNEEGFQEKKKQVKFGIKKKKKSIKMKSSSGDEDSSSSMSPEDVTIKSESEGYEEYEKS